MHQCPQWSSGYDTCPECKGLRFHTLLKESERISKEQSKVVKTSERFVDWDYQCILFFVPRI